MTPKAAPQSERDVVFISKGTPDDDQFVLWLAPRLEVHGYKVFADILSLEPGDRWRREITGTLQNKAIKMLLCCTDETLAKAGVQEEIGIAEDLVKQLQDPRFIIPLRLKKFKKLFGIGELQYIDFENRWAGGLAELLDKLHKQQVPCGAAQINPNWENYRRRFEIEIEDAPERLTSNWLRIIEIPDTIRYFQPTGSIDHAAMQQVCRDWQYPAEPYLRGFFSFADANAVNRAFENVAKLIPTAEIPLLEFVESGADVPDIQGREASNIVMSILRRAWESYARDRGLLDYFYSQSPGFHVTDKHLGLGKKIPWGRQGDRRSSMLRNKAKGKIWQFGVTANPSLWPFPQYRLKSRVLFAEAEGERAGKVFDDKQVQHRYRRSVCKGWRNKQWHGRLMAFLELLSGEDPTIRLPVADSVYIKLDAMPCLFTSPVTTVLPDVLDDEDEDDDDDTLGNFALPEEDED